MADGVSNNLFLINAPAGSGKTTTIYKQIEKIVREEKTTSILCITYTNRAVEELERRLEGYTVKIMTIHAFLSEFMKPYFSNPKVVQLYFDVYGKQIKGKIQEDVEKGERSRRYTYYTKKYGTLDYDNVKKNVSRVYYNEREFNSWYDGGIGHDDLLSFSLSVLKEYPIIRTKLTESFRYIFIDEYQDTSANVLHFFYRCVKDSTSKLYLFGDKMQQIYNKYDGSFESEFQEFDTREKLRTNYRSTPAIIKLLNGIYNNQEYAQFPPENKKELVCNKPRLIITNEMKNCIEAEEKAMSGDVLKLYITNRERFEKIGVAGLYSQVENLKNEDGDKLYGWGKKYSVVDVMTGDEDQNPEALFRFFLIIDRILQHYNRGEYGTVIQILRNKEKGKDKFFQNRKLDVKTHQDKERLRKTLEIINEMYSETSNKTVRDMIEYLSQEELIKSGVAEQFFSEQYAGMLTIPVKEFVKLNRGLEKHEVSTQHGVKGEGHDQVFFIAEDCSSLGIGMYDFFKMRTEIEVEFQSMQKFYYEYKREVDRMKGKFGDDSFKNANAYKSVYKEVRKYAEEIDTKFGESQYYQYCYQEDYKNGVAKDATYKYIKNYMNINQIKNILLAYKLFYVGCSRAKKELAVFVFENKIQSYKTEFISTFEKMGFEVVEIGE